MTNSKKRSIKRIVALLLALSLVMTPALAYATEFESIYFEPGQVCPYDEEREARIAELLEELEMIDEKLEELREQREVYLSKIALLTEQKRELQKRIDELRDDSEYYPDYYSEVEADQETYEPEPENTSPELPAERQPIDRPSNGGAVENGRPNDAASNESNTRQPAYETPVNNVPENNQPAEEAPANGAPIVEYSPRVLEMMREHQLFLEQQGIEPEAPAVNNTPASDDSSIIVSVLHFFATPVHAFEGDYDYEFDYEPGYADLSGTSDLADFSNILDQLDENASLEELESALADVVEKLEQYTNALYALEAEIAYLEELREAVAAELDALVMGIMPFGAHSVGTWAELLYFTNTTNAPVGVPTTIVLTANIEVPTAAPTPPVFNVGPGQIITLAGDFTLSRSVPGESHVIQMWGGNNELTIDGPTISGGGQSGIRVGTIGGTAHAGATLNLVNGSIQDNSAVSGGGVLVGYGNTFNMSGGTISGNTAQSGGGVFVSANSTFNMTAGTIDGNFATGDTAGIGNDRNRGAEGGGVHVIGANASFVMSGGIIANNTTNDQRHRHGGGGVAIGCADTSGASFYIYPNAVIRDNHSGSQGGGVAVHEGNIFTMNGGEITGNTARINGGGVATWGVFTLEDGDITNNSAQGATWSSCGFGVHSGDINGTGGGVFVGQNLGRFNMNGGLIANNCALLGGGIGLSALEFPPRVYIRGGEISDNYARHIGECPATAGRTGYGGAIYMRGFVSVVILDGLITGNSADRNGGAIAVGALTGDPDDLVRRPNGQLRITGGRILDNEANHGGAIYTALDNVWPDEARYIFITEDPVFRYNHARFGPTINTHVANINQDVIRPGTVTYYYHAFTDHDIFVPTKRNMSIVKEVVNPYYPLPMPPIQVGDEITYRFTITNLVDEPVFHILLQDELPAELRFVRFGDFTPNPPILPPNVTMRDPAVERDYINGVVTVDIYALPANGVFIIDVIVEVESAGETGVIENVAWLSFENIRYQPPIRVNDSETIVVDDPEVTVVKEADENVAYVGDLITYTITVKNNGPGAATGIVVTDMLPAEVEFVRSTSNARGINFNYDNGELVAIVGTLAEDAYIVFTVVVRAIAETEEGSPAVNRAEVDGDNFEYVYDEEEVTINPPLTAPLAVVEVEKIAYENEVYVGDLITYTITVTNNGPGAATGIVVTDELPDQVEFITSTSNSPGINFTHNDGVLVAIVGTLAEDAYIVFTVVVRAIAETEEDAYAKNIATVSGANFYDVYDEEEVTINPPLTTPPPDVVVEKRANANVVRVNDLITYTITVINNGSGAATGIVVTDELPVEVEFVSSTSSIPGINFTHDDGVLVAIVGTLEEGEPIVFTVIVRAITATADNDYATNVATVSGGNFPYVYDEEDVNINPPIIITPDPPVVVVTKVAADNDTPFTVGDEIVYTITVTNNGPGVATNVVVTDELPEGVEFYSTTADDYDFDDAVGPSGTLTVELGDIAVGTTVSFEIVVIVTADVDEATQIENFVVVTGDNFDDVDDKEIVDILPENAARLELSKVANDPERERRLGQYVTYTFTVRNVGGEPASDIRVIDSLPPGLQFVSYDVPEGAEFDICKDNRNIEVTYKGPLAPNGILIFTVTTRVTISSGTIVNNAYVYLGDVRHDEDSATIYVRRPGGGGNGYTPQPPGPGQNIPDPDPPVGQYPQDPHDPPYEIEPPRTPLDPGPDRPGDQPPTGDVPRTGATGGSAGLMLLSLLALIALAAIGRKRETDGLAHKKI